MPMYEYRCKNGHETEAVYRVAERPDHVRCRECGSRAKSFISGTRIGSCWPEGRSFEHITDKPGTVFKNYKELERYAEKNGSHIDALSPSQIRVKQEERRHKSSKGIKSTTSTKNRKKLKVPEKIEKAFRECPTVESAMKALKENRI